MEYIKLVIHIQDDYQEILIAELLDLDFDSFEQQDDRIITCVQKSRFNDVNRERIKELVSAFPGNGYIKSEELVADQNWNEAWERTIQPVRTGRFFIKPTWSNMEVPDDLTLLEIDPKMSFGTGYHETTRLMLKLIPEVIKGGEQVVDVGTGTGILAIAAVKAGAANALAVDVDDWSVTNAIENTLINRVSGEVEVRKGSLETAPQGSRFDAVLANIDRNTLVGMMDRLVEMTVDSGHLLLSGILKKDEDNILSIIQLKGLSHVKTIYENEWIAIHLKKR